MSDSSTALQDFAQQVCLTEKVWALQGPEGWAVCESIEFEETDVMPFFSDQESASKLCSGEWQSYTPASFTLEELLEDWLPGMHEDQVMVGVHWDKDMDGPEFEPADVAAALS